MTEKVRHLKPVSIPDQDLMIQFCEDMLKAVRKGKIVGLMAIALETGDDYQEIAITPKGTRLTMIGAIDLLKDRICTNMIQEHDNR